MAKVCCLAGQKLWKEVPRQHDLVVKAMDLGLRSEGFEFWLFLDLFDAELPLKRYF